MSSFLGRVKELMGLNDPADLIEGEYEEVSSQEYRSLYEDQQRPGDYSSDFSPRRRNWQSPEPSTDWSSERPRPIRSSRERTSPGDNVIGLPSAQRTTGEVVVMEPRSFDEMASVVRHLRDRKSVVMNLTLMEAAEAQRSVDFVAGGTFAIDGHQERIGENIFLFTPNCVAVSTPTSQAEGEQSTATPAPRPIPMPIWSPNEEPVPLFASQR